MSPRIRDLLKKLTLLALTLFSTLLLSEFAARLLFPGWAPRTGRLVELWQYDRAYGWSHVPGSSGRFASFGFDTHVEINSRGFRGPEPPARKDPSKRRILAVGDSFTWGFGVEYDEIFASRIESACSGVEVINLGVSGYSTDQELLLFREEGAELQPDIVILVVAANDFASNMRFKEYVYYYKPFFVVEDGELVVRNRPVLRANPGVRFAASVSKRSYLLTQLNRTMHGMRKLAEQKTPGVPRPTTESASTTEYPRSPVEQLTGKLLEAFISSVEVSGATPIVVFVDGLGERARRMARYLEPTGAELILIDDHMPFESYDEYHLQDDFHWNPKGHTVVGDAVLDAMISSGLLPREACGTRSGSATPG